MGIGGLILQEKDMAATNCDIVYDCEVKRNPDKTVVENFIDTYDYPIRTLELNYFCASKRNGFTYRFCKKLFSVTDVERNFGYGKHGWVQFKDYEYAVKFKGRKYTDAESLIPAFSNELVPLKYTKKNMIKNEMFASEFGEELKKIAEQNKFKPILTLDETKKFLELIDTDDIDEWFEIHRNFHVDIDTAQKAVDEVNQMLVPEESDKMVQKESDELSHMSYADMLIMYGTLLKKYDELLEEAIAARDNVCEIRENLTEAEEIFAQKEKQVEDNKEKIIKMRQELASNAYLIEQRGSLDV